MNWSAWRLTPWIDTRARFVASVARNGSLLDLGSSDGGTLKHIHELRPDLSLSSSDIAGNPGNYPPGTDFRRANFDIDDLPWPDRSFDGITCMHVVEHLERPSRLISEASRVLRPGGRIYIETPHQKTVSLKSAKGKGTEHVTVNFYDDKTHIRPVPHSELEKACVEAGLSNVRSGTSRNLIFAAAFPFLFLLRPRSRLRYVAQLHFTGWSIFTEAMRRA